MARSIGLDFGTSNSAIAIAEPGAPPRLARFRRGNGEAWTSPSVLYFEPPGRGAAARIQGGHRAIEAYLESESRGRFVQSLKTYLPDRHFDGTTIGRRKQSLEELIALILGELRSEATADLGPLTGRAVVGRPVTFQRTQDDEESRLAVSRMTRALEAAGFDDVVFEYEPVAAAYAYEQRLSGNEIILVADFGGGTSDFSLLEVGAAHRHRNRRDIIGTAGLPIGGDVFDRQLVRHIVAPRLGAGAEYLSALGKLLPVPAWPYAHLERWHHLSFLRSADTIDMLQRVAATAVPAGRIDGLLNLIEHDLGFELHRAIQRLKFALSAAETAEFRFDAAPITIRQDVSRAEFEGWIGEQRAAVAESVDALLTQSGLTAARVDRVFLTGGSSFVPAIRRIFADRFGDDRLVGGDEMTSVATGLALRGQVTA